MRKRTIQSSNSYFKKNYDLYLMLIPGLIFILLFKFVPYIGNVIAFKDFEFGAGNNLIEAILNSKWVGLENFKRIFMREDALNAIKNTFVLTFYKMLFVFPLPIILSLLLNEVRKPKLKSTMQTIVYFPNFLSWVIVGTLFLQLLQNGGILYNAMNALGIQDISFFNDSKYFRSLLIFTDAWKSTGYGTIVYLAAMGSIDPTLYEAAEVDGCSRFRKIWSITLPSILSVISMMLVLTLGSQLAFGSFEQVMAMYNSAVYETGDIIQTYTYRIGLTKLDYSMSTAVGMFNTTVALVFIFISNGVLKKITGKSIW